MFVLQLNPMMEHHEVMEPVARAETIGALKAFVESERVEPYSDDAGMNMCGGKLRKSFRKNGPLEYLNPPDRNECIVDVGTPEDWAARAIERYHLKISRLPLLV